MKKSEAQKKLEQQIIEQTKKKTTPQDRPPDHPQYGRHMGSLTVNCYEQGTTVTGPEDFLVVMDMIQRGLAVMVAKFSQIRLAAVQQVENLQNPN